MARLTSRNAHDDLLLWTQFLEGSVTAWGTLLDAHYHILFNYGLRFGIDRERSHDCVHDLFLDLWDGRQRLNATLDNVSFYLLRAFRNKLIREKQHERTHQELNEITTEHLQETPAEDWLISEETIRYNGLRLKGLLTTLPARQQEAIYLKFYANLSNKQVAELMHLQQQSVANLLHTALQRLRSLWGISSGLALWAIALRWWLS
ncbi:RNA polymerase sigma factor [Spirosoma montaniterrae]|uniref:RNA polymerase subunit sigma-24 n=1 Tax=Spirosoma montaniterrae TaxID=1178516 RepID=A0A1P9WV86_9BACT|nr:sigma-70 family RNA polymerase sigma factor [Spirosoma montaniterrae]AQG79281.1 hypothetical protein AWR27_08045 [Spirosoma montaniterrae]